MTEPVFAPGTPQGVIAAGTGLGQAGLYWDGQRHHAFPTEGGHTDFAPADELRDLLEAVPGRVILNEGCGLLGAARHAATRIGTLAA